MMLLILYAVAILKTFNLSMTCYEDWSRLLILDYFPIMLDQSEVKLVLSLPVLLILVQQN